MSVNQIFADSGNTAINKRDDIDSILNFLEEIGIEYKIDNGIQGSFAENINIKNGVVHFDYNKVLVVDLLHESGHLALVLKEYRPLLSGWLDKGLKEYSAMIDKLHHSDPRLDILMCCDDNQVTAWAWAVGCKLGLNPDDVITSESYGGEGDSVRFKLSISGQSPMPYIGVSALHHAGFTKKYSYSAKLNQPKISFYPFMNYWTTDEALLANNYSLNISL